MSASTRSVPSSAALTGFAVVTLLTTTWLLHRKQATARKAASDSTSSSAPQERTLPAEVREEQLSRHALYFGADGMVALQNAKICVIGLGGVGSHTAHMLARSGVGYLRLVDFDQVTLSSLNRHACATLSDVGIPKAVCLARFCRQICPDPTYLQLDPRVEMYTAETGPALLAGETWDVVIDAIDDVPTKAALLAHCLEHNIKVVSCMGAGGKSDPTRLHLSDLRTAAKDPLASKLRQHLKKLFPDTERYLDDMDALTVLYNSEMTVVKMADLTPDQKEAGADQFGAVENMRVRIIPVLGTTPAIMGQALAAVVVTRVGNKPIGQPVAGERVGKNVRNKMFQHLVRREGKIYKRVGEQAGLEKMPTDDDDIYNIEKGWWIDMSTGTASRSSDDKSANKIWIGPLQIVQEDIDYLMQVWRNRCAVTSSRLG
jgi:tRNA A37 threonylcarbamoyladenosine dehydratase